MNPATRVGPLAWAHCPLEPSSAAAWLICSASRERLAAYLQEVDFDLPMAEAIAGFSIRQAGWFVLSLALALGLVALLLSGYFNGRRARAGLRPRHQRPGDPGQIGQRRV